jgi:hypothetical protein
MTPFTTYLVSPISKGTLTTTDGSRFAEPEVLPSIENPYPDRVRRKREPPRSNAPI